MNVFRSLTEKKCVWPLFYSLGCVAVVYMNLVEFLMPRLEVEGSSDRPFQEDGAERTILAHCSWACLVVSRVLMGINLRLPVLSFGHVYPLTIYYPISFVVVTYTMPTTLSKLAGRIVALATRNPNKCVD